MDKEPLTPIGRHAFVYTRGGVWSQFTGWKMRAAGYPSSSLTPSYRTDVTMSEKLDKEATSAKVSPATSVLDEKLGAEASEEGASRMSWDRIVPRVLTP